MHNSTHSETSSPVAVMMRTGQAGDQPEEAPNDLRCGFGACYKCNCKHFEGNDQTCANSGCGHAYSDHW